MIVREGSAAAPPPALPTRHPEDSLLMAYAAGSLPEAAALVVATHMAYCPLCRAEVGRFEAVGGALLDDASPAEVDSGALDAVLARLDGREPAPAPAPAFAQGTPRPLRDYLGGTLEEVKWRRLIPGVRQAPIAVADPAARLGLLKIKAGSGVPVHTHEGGELTLVLRGWFTDSTGAYRPGDFAYADDELTHRPIAGEGDDCICLALNEGPMRLTGPVGRLLNPFVR